MPRTRRHSINRANFLALLQRQLKIDDNYPIEVTCLFYDASLQVLKEKE